MLIHQRALILSVVIFYHFLFTPIFLISTLGTNQASSARQAMKQAKAHVEASVHGTDIE